MKQNKNLNKFLTEEQVKALTPFEIFKRGVLIMKRLMKMDPQLIEKNIEFSDDSYSSDYEDNILGAGIYMTLSDKNDGLSYELQENKELFYPTNKRLIELTHLSEYNNLSNVEKLIFDDFIKMHWEFKEVWYDDDIDHESAGYGSNYSVVYYFPVYDLYIKFVGSYSSYRGAICSNFMEVKPKEKTIIVYE
jgi:hypothetical protein